MRNCYTNKSKRGHTVYPEAPRYQKEEIVVLIIKNFEYEKYTITMKKRQTVYLEAPRNYPIEKIVVLILKNFEYEDKTCGTSYSKIIFR